MRVRVILAAALATTALLMLGGASAQAARKTPVTRRMAIGAPALAARMMSGISRSSPQSPPPITLPARTVATATRLSSPKKDSR